MRRSGSTWAMIVCSLLVAGGVADAQTSSDQADQADGTHLRAVAEQHGAALVTVKAVVETAMRGMPQGTHETENEVEVTGLVVDPAGLVLVSNTQLGGFAELMKHFMGASGIEMVSTPTRLKVLLGPDQQETAAHIVARDTDLDLAWIQLDEPPESPLPAVELRAEPPVQVGQRFVVLGRLEKSFGRALTAVEGRIAAVASKPRRLFVPAVQVGYGSPVFSLEGRLLGISVLQLTPDGGTAASGNPLAMMNRSMTLGSRLLPMILPASRVAEATESARQLATASEAERSPPETD